MDSSPHVVGIAGSIRNRAGLQAVEGVDENVGGKELVDRIQELSHRDIYHEDFLGEIQPLIQDLTEGDERVITNSDALLLTGLYGAMDTASIEFHKLTDYTGLNESYASTHVDSRDFKPLVEILERADGLILGTPVYFGDRSSLMHSFINFASERGLLEGKVIGTVSVGSKRNGGQETTNVYALFEALDHGGIIVGNGPKTCQYGGTGWGGDIGDVATDDFGLETSLGTGLRVSAVARLRKLARKFDHGDIVTRTPDPFKVGVLVTRDVDDRLQTVVERIRDRIDRSSVEINVIDFSETFIQACIGCDVCPTPGKVEEVTGTGKDYKCIIDSELDEERWGKDQLQNLHDQLINNDALVVGVLDTDDKEINDVYQTLLERTRYIRRDDWRLHNTPLAAFVVANPDSHSTYPMKVMTSWMRHNTIVHPPIIHNVLGSDANEKIPTDAADQLQTHYFEGTVASFDAFIESAQRFRAAAEIGDEEKLSYKATGYQNKILDKTVAERK